MDFKKIMDAMPAFYDEEKKIWSGGEADKFYHPDCSIGQIIYQSLKNHPNNVLQISDTEGTKLTNKDVLTAAKRIAQHFKKMGLNHNDVIGIIATNTTYVLSLFVACVFNCTPFHSVSPSYDEKTFTQIYGITKPKLIFCDGQVYEKIRAATRAFEPTIYTLFEHIDGVPKILDLLEPTQSELSYSPEPLTLGGIQTMAILCSSGTTGLPKAICMSNARLQSNLKLLCSEDVVFCSNGIEWITGLWLLISNCVTGFTHIISNKPFEPDYFIDMIAKYKVSLTVLVPRYIAAIIKSPKATVENFASLRFIGSGSCAISFRAMNALRNLNKKTFISFAYGSTEIGGATTNFDVSKEMSVGKLIAGNRARIVDESGQNVGPGHIGEIYIDNCLPWHGYYNNPKQTKEACDSDGWFHTGDLGYFDEHHYLYVVDRKKDIVKYNGFHFWPSEIEACIMEIPDVDEVYVVCSYDEVVGDKAGALVVKSKGSSISAEDVENYVASKLVLPHKQLHAGVLFVDSIPYNLNGKRDKMRAKAIFAAAFDCGEL